MLRRWIAVALVSALCLFPLSGALAAKKVSKIRISPATLELDVGLTEQLSVQFKPAGASSPVKWKSSNQNIVVVDEDGYVTAVGAGRAIVAARTKNGKTAKCKITVSDPKMVVALTFDDGPNAHTPDVLKTLKKYKSKATFFMLGSQAEMFPDIARQVAEADCEIGNHTMGHKSLRKLTQDEAIEELQKGADAIELACGQAPTVIRAPYGNIPDGLPEAMQATFVQWSIDPEDWKSRNAVSVYKHIMEKVQPGSVILMHDIYDSTAAAVEKLVPALIKKGYKLVTVSELLKRRGIDDPAGQIVY